MLGNVRLSLESHRNRKRTISLVRAEFVNYNLPYLFGQYTRERVCINHKTL